MNKQVNALRIFSFLLLFINTFSITAQNDRATMVQSIIEEKLRMPDEQLDQWKERMPIIASFRENEEIKITGATSEDVEEAEPFIAVNPTDSNNIVVSFMEQGGGSLNFPVYYTLDGGLTWAQSSISTTTIFNNDPINEGEPIGGGGDPIFAFDSNGKLYFSWLYATLTLTTGDFKFHVYWAYSNNKGQDFELEEGEDHFIIRGALNLLTSQTTDYQEGVFDRPWFAVDRSGGPFDGSLYCTGLFIPGSMTDLDGEGIVLRIKRADEATFMDFNAPISSVQSGINVQFANVEVDGNGHVHVTYGDVQSQSVMHAVSTDGGLTFSPPVEVGEFSWENQGDKLVHGRENPVPSLAVAPTGNEVHAVWSTFDYTSNLVDGLYARSIDGGANWTEPMSLATLAVQDSMQSLMPTAAINDEGDLSISWFSLDEADKGSYYVMQSRDNGQNFDLAEQVATDSTDFSEYPIGSQFLPGAFFGDYNCSERSGCKTYSVWSDGRSEMGPKIYVSITDHCEGVVSFQENIPVTDQFSVGPVFPNPVTADLSFEVNLKKSSKVTIQLLNSEGKIAADLYTGVMRTGEQKQIFTIETLPAGIYYLSVETAWGIRTRKVVKQ